MRRISLRVVCLIALLGILSGASFAQVATGIPPFSSIGGGPFDSVNLGNLNVHFAIPIVHKPGRGIPFNYDMGYDSTVWQPVGVSGSFAWQPAPQWGWSPANSADPGYISFNTQSTQCITNGHITGSETSYYNFQYLDSGGTTHGMGGNILLVGGSCNGATSINSFVSYANDGSGLSLHVSMGIPGAASYVVTAGGVELNPGVGVTDNNGNTISEGSWPYTDTLGTHPLNSSTTSTTTTYTYTDPSGATQNIVFTYVPYSVQTAFGCTGISEYGPTTNNLLDHVTLADGSKYTFTYEATLGHIGKVTGRIASVTLPTGGTIAYTYNMNCTDGTTSNLTRTMTPGGLWQYWRTGSGSSWTTHVSDPGSKWTTIDFFLNTTTGNTYETQRKVYSDSGSSLMLTTYNCWNNNFTSCATQSVASPIGKKDAYTLLPTGELRLSETSYNTNGLVTEDKEFDWGVNSTGAPTVAPVKDTVTTYNTTLGNGIVNRPSSVVVKNGSGTTVASTSYSYDETTPTGSGATQLASIGGSRGNVTTIAKLANGSTTLYQKMTYYDTGMLASSTGTSTSSTTPGPNTTYGYATGTSCNYAFPTSVAEPLGLTKSMTWNCYGGVIASSTDENNETTSYSYDNEWRSNQTNYPDGGQVSTNYNINSSPSNIVTTKKIDSTHNFVTTSILDGFGRTIHTQRNSDPFGVATVDITYDKWGRVDSTSTPYFTTGDPTYGVTTYGYDALNRRTSVTHPDGSSASMTYTGAAVETQDEGNGTHTVTRIYQRDGLGRLASVCEVSSASQMGSGGTPSACGQDIAATGFITTYTYDPLGNLLAVVQSGLNGRSYSYDALSRKMSETDPESGTKTYSYDSCSAGDLCSRTAPKPNQTGAATVTTSYSYDAVHRLTQTSYNDGVTPSVFRVYDVCCSWGYTQTNPKGRLHAEWVGTLCCESAGQIFSYDAMGRVIQNVQCTPLNCGSPNVAMNYTYDLAGDMTSESNGFGWTYSFSYNTAQELTGVTSSMVDSTHPGTLLSNPQYNALGKVTSATLGDGLPGDGIGESYTYDSRGRITHHSSGVLGGPGNWGIQNITYMPNSDLQSVWDSATGGTWSYTYDDFNRLSSSSSNPNSYYGSTSLTYAYDRFGNRWQQNVNGTPSPSYVFDSNNRIAGSGVLYDAAGNIMVDGLGHTYTYDAEGRMLTVDGGSTASYAYDASGRRIQKTTGSTTVYMAYDLSGHMQAEYTSATVNRFEVYQPDNGRHLVTYEYSNTLFDFQDQVGTDQLKITQTGDSNYESDGNFPFGDHQIGWGGVYLAGGTHFTGMNTDSETGLSHAWFRQYSSTQGRWMMPDPGGQEVVDPTNPQSWNQYAYVMNNPTNFIDLVGLECYAYDAGGNCTNSGGSFGNLATMGGWADPFQMSNITVIGPAWVTYRQYLGSVIYNHGYSDLWMEDGKYLGEGPIGNGFDSLGIDWGWWGTFASNLFSWKEAKQAQKSAWNKGYYKCLAKKNLPGFGGAATAHAVGDVANEAAARYAPQIAGAYYHFTDGRFTAWGKASKVLVPEAAEGIKLWSERLNIAGLAYADYELAESISECSDTLQ
jgi:RHS repeat-associated protein